MTPLSTWKLLSMDKVNLRYDYLFALVAEKVKELQPSISHICHLCTDAILAFILSIYHLQRDTCWFTVEDRVGVAPAFIEHMFFSAVFSILCGLNKILNSFKKHIGFYMSL